LFYKMGRLAGEKIHLKHSLEKVNCSFQNILSVFLITALKYGKL